MSPAAIFPGRRLTPEEKYRRYVERHPGAEAARARARHAAGRDADIRTRFAEAHPGYDAERNRVARLANPERFKLAERRWRKSHPAAVRAKVQRRRGLPWVWLHVDPWPLDCQICGDTLDPGLRFPHPLAETLGHEPPVAWMRLHPDHSGSLVLRPEHWSCNLRKFDKPDWELSK